MSVNIQTGRKLRSRKNENVLINPDMDNIIIDRKENMCINTCIKSFSINVIGKNMKKEKMTDNNFKILKYSDYELLIKYNYNVKQMKTICKHYKLKQSGTKMELVNRIYNYLRLTHYINKIQKVWRKYLLNKIKKLRGPGYLNIKNCVNDTDFLTIDNLKDIPYNEFFSYESNNIIYAFNINSIYQLYINNSNNNNSNNNNSNNKQLLNPYNREPIPKQVRMDINKLITLSSFFGEKIINLKQDKPVELSFEKKLELRTISIFQNIDILGNITNHLWFWNLGRILQIKFIRSIIDIWMYRADLSFATKREICPPTGDPFTGINTVNNRLATMSLNDLRIISLNIIEALVTKGINTASKYLGSSYILCALTLVSDEAAGAYPWLYESVVPI